MSDSDSPSQELRDLLSAACDGKADAAARRRLEELVRNDESAADLLTSYAWLHTELWRSVSAAHAEQAANATLAGAFVDESAKSEPLSAQAPHAPVLRRPFRRLSSRWSLLAMAASVAVAAAILLRPTGDLPPATLPKLNTVTLVRPPLQIACVTRVDGAVWAGGVERSVGSLLSQGETLELVQGAAQVSMAFGADLVLQSPCRLVLVERSLVRLETGKLTIEVAPWASGFMVETSGLRVTDLGTRFAVSADSSDVAEVHVLEGAVVVEALRSQGSPAKSVTLKAGQAMRVDRIRSEAVRLAAQGNRFVSYVDPFQPLRPIALPNTGIGLKVGEVDPHWHITAGSNASPDDPIPAVVGEADRVYLDNAPESSQWISVPEGTTRGVPELTTHTFETTFNLTGLDLSTVRVVGQMLADNGVSAIRLNGKPVAIVPWEEVLDDYDYCTFHVVRINEGFVEGKNRLAIDVINTGWADSRAKLPTPMGLRIEWQAFGRPSVDDSSRAKRLEGTL
jgi:hypothetical protein